MRDLEDERDAVDLAAVTGDYVAASSSDVPQQRTESAGGGVDFRVALPRWRTPRISPVASARPTARSSSSTAASSRAATPRRRHRRPRRRRKPGGVILLRARRQDRRRHGGARLPGVAVSPDGRTAYFHGGYRVWDGGDDFADADDLSIFDGDASRWTCADDDWGAGELGGRGRCSPRHSVTPASLPVAATNTSP